MQPKARSPITYCNDRLRAAGRTERLRRARGGYLCLAGGDASRMRESGIYAVGRDIEPARLWAMVRDLFQSIDVSLED
jgi:hypothetical protein